MENKKKIIIAICAVIGVIVVAVGGIMISCRETKKPVIGDNSGDKKVVKKVDDWKYDDDANENERGFLSGITNSFNSLQSNAVMNEKLLFILGEWGFRTW